jgi:hypothetical protein
MPNGIVHAISTAKERQDNRVSEHNISEAVTSGSGMKAVSKWVCRGTVLCW